MSVFNIEKKLLEDNLNCNIIKDEDYYILQLAPVDDLNNYFSKFSVDKLLELIKKANYLEYIYFDELNKILLTFVDNNKIELIATDKDNKIIDLNILSIKNNINIDSTIATSSTTSSTTSFAGSTYSKGCTIKELYHIIYTIDKIECPNKEEIHEYFISKIKDLDINVVLNQIDTVIYNNIIVNNIDEKYNVLVDDLFPDLKYKEF